MTFSYFMRSQNCTYAMDSAKKAIVTAIQRTSCMGSSLVFECGFPQSQGDPQVGWRFAFLLLNLRAHRDERPSPLQASGPARKVPHLAEQSHQKAKPKQHCDGAQNCQRYSHNHTGLSFAPRLLTFIGQLRA